MKELTVYILSRNRPEYLKQALCSVLKNYDDFVEIIVSDNSTSVEFEARPIVDSDKYKYIRRSGKLNVDEHNAVCLSETSTPYVMLFHDDDLLGDDYIKICYDCLKSDQSLVAVCGNALVLLDDNLTTINLFENDKKIKSAEQLLYEYFVPKANYQAPCPGYIYKTEALKQIDIYPSDLVGKYRDLVVLTKLLTFGSIQWIGKATMHYRLHLNNDSNVEDFFSRRKLFEYYLKTGNDEVSMLLKSNLIYYEILNIKRLIFSKSFLPSAKIVLMVFKLFYYQMLKSIRIFRFKK